MSGYTSVHDQHPTANTRQLYRAESWVSTMRSTYYRGAMTWPRGDFLVRPCSLKTGVPSFLPCYSRPRLHLSIHLSLPHHAVDATNRTFPPTIPYHTIPHPSQPRIPLRSGPDCTSVPLRVPRIRSLNRWPGDSPVACLPSLSLARVAEYTYINARRQTDRLTRRRLGLEMWLLHWFRTG